MAKKTTPKLRTLTADDRRWADKLEDWIEQIDMLSELLQGQRRLLGHEAEEARAQFTAFKRDLRAEVKRLAELRRRGELHGFAINSYAPAIEQAEAFVTIKTKSIPGPAWFHAFYDTRITLNYPLTLVENKKR